MKIFHECRHFLRLNRDQEMSAGKNPRKNCFDACMCPSYLRFCMEMFALGPNDDYYPAHGNCFHQIYDIVHSTAYVCSVIQFDIYCMVNVGNLVL